MPVPVIVFPFVMIRMIFYLPVFAIMTVANDCLVMTPPVAGIFIPVIVGTRIRPWFIDHYFIDIIEVICTIPARE
jgi:hypothetical protein